MGAVMEMLNLNPVLEVLGAISSPVKIAWGVWLLWAVAQLVWWFWPAGDERIYRTTAPPPVRAAVEPRSPVTPRPRRVVAAAATVSPYGTSDFLAVLDQEQRQAAAEPPEMPLAPEADAAPYEYPLDVSKL